MHNLIKKLLEWSENKPQPKGLSSETINAVSNYCQEHFGSPLPQGYMDFLKEMNGFEYDGNCIYCCYNNDIINNFPRYDSLDLVSFNTRFVENTDIDEFIFLGKTSLDYIAYNKKTKKFIQVSHGNVMGRIYGEYETFEDAIYKMFILRKLK